MQKMPEAAARRRAMTWLLDGPIDRLTARFFGARRTAVWFPLEAAAQFTAIQMKFPRGYAAFVEELPGANTQGETLDEAGKNMPEAVQLVLESKRLLAEESLAAEEVIREPLTRL